MSRSSSPPPTEEEVAILPLRNSVLFPMSVVPINVGRPRSVRLVEELAERDRALVGVVTQRASGVVEPAFGDLYRVGTLARVVKVIRLGRANYSVVLNGLSRFRITDEVAHEPYMRARVARFGDPRELSESTRAIAEQLREKTRQVLELLPDLPRETAGILDNVHDPAALADLIASNFQEEQVGIDDRQRILEATEVSERLTLVLGIVSRRLELLETKDRISGEVREEMSRSQREYVLREQMRTILEELGEAGDEDDVDALRLRVARAEMPAEAAAAARKQLSRLRSMQPQSAEYNVARTYVEWLADLPWSRTTPDQIEVSRVRQCLDEDHYGLDTVKRRIVEYTAIRQLRRDKKGPILLFVGPPGVGKTSLGRSIARAMGRRYGRIALGGVRDEAEVRGHRRTYVGALPGRLIQALKKAGSRNPVLILDEVDKLGSDVRGDPSAALLEVLDPEQNDTFIDHYLDVPFDLSQVTFLATANDRSAIPDALRDRMEIIEVPGYTRTEKRQIAEQFLVLKQLREHGLTEEQLAFGREGLESLIDHYTREAGVRGLEREIAAICRHVAVRLAEGEEVNGTAVTPALVEQVLGAQRYRPELAERKLIPGVATGLGLSGAGGEILFVEATLMPGKGKIRMTGSMRNVMKESAATAVSYVRSRADRFGLDPEWLRSKDLHVHIARGAATRDGASNGLAIFVAVTSLLLRSPVRPDVAMNGELTLRGALLPVAGVKAKLLAAHRGGIRLVLLPERNACDLEEVPDEILRELNVRFVRHVSEALEIVLEGPNRAKAPAAEAQAT